MEIRTTSINDIEELSELVRQATEYNVSHIGHYELNHDFDWLAYTEAKLRNRNEHIFVAENNNRALAGFIDSRIVRYPHPSGKKSMFSFVCKGPGAENLSPIKPLKWGVIDECYVIPSLRRQGIGSHLVTKAIAWFKAENIGRIELSVVAENTYGEAFWKKYGFEPFRHLLSRTI